MLDPLQRKELGVPVNASRVVAFYVHSQALPSFIPAVHSNLSCVTTVAWIQKMTDVLWHEKSFKKLLLHLEEFISPHDKPIKQSNQEVPFLINSKYRTARQDFWQDHNKHKSFENACECGLIWAAFVMFQWSCCLLAYYLMSLAIKE